jgi:xanthine dehydrogenase YagT iron-sulfur-binding subunit
MGERSRFSRRAFCGKAGTAAAAAALLAKSKSVEAALPDSDTPEHLAQLSLNINGVDHQVAIDCRTTLLDLLRERLGLTGSKKGCDHGQCGACTVLAGRQRVLSCLTLAVAVRDPVTTIEGLAGADGSLHPMQQAFIEHDAFQCGYCTPGQILSGIACVREHHADSDAMIREYMSGNICRCAAYPNIVTAIKEAKTQMEQA